MPKLIWDGYQEGALKDTLAPPTTTLDLTGVNPQDNLFITGDNLEGLKHLHDNGIEVNLILTDPPYDTGGKDFVYNDRFGSDAWLNFAYPRFYWTYSVLNESGVIMVNIDRNSHHYLRCIMDDIYGKKNHLIDYVWKKKCGGGNDTTGGYTTHEYVVTYSKERSKVKKLRVPLEEHQLKAYGNWDNDPRGDYKLESMLLRRGACQIEGARVNSNRYYTVTHPTDGREVTGIWIGDKESMDKLWADNRLYWPSGRKAPNKKVFLSERLSGGITPTSIISHSAFLTQTGRRDLEALDLATEAFMGHRQLIWDFPKPVELIKYLLKPFDKDITVLDIFAGSATTAQAVMEANAEDGGTRNWVMMQLPEQLPEESVAAKDFGLETLDEVGKLRINRVIEKLKQQPNLFDKQKLEFKEIELKEAQRDN